MKILLTFTGFHDPFSAGGVDGDLRAGPVLTVVAEGGYDRVFLFSTPKMAGISDGTADAIRERHSECEVEVVEIALKDPTNYLGILRQIRGRFREIHQAHPDASYSISVASGTPQMHACWLLLAASGEIPAKILQSLPSEFVPEGKSQVREVDLSKQGFPKISIGEPQSISAGEDGEELEELCRELGIIGEDPSFLKVLQEAKIYAEYDDIHLLLLGETGSGKEYLARFLHRASPRANQPMVTVNCSAIPKDLVESQLFGHKKGAFTGASSDQIGKFKAADGGVLFLDELGELPIEAQAKLLRALDQGEIEPLGSKGPVKVDVRVVGATNQNIREMVKEGTFREDLFQRFGANLEIPPLRRRQVDVSKLALHILNGWNAKHRKQKVFTADAITELVRYPWPGNVRELHRVIFQSAMLAPKTRISPDDLRFDEPIKTNPLASLPDPEEGFEMGAFLEEMKLALIDRALEKSGNVQAKASKLLGITPQALNQFLKNRSQ
jgi:DNA-binding NtrC family response regulator